MVNRLSDLARFLADESVPAWVKDELRLHRDEILLALQQGKSYTLQGPDGEKVTIDPDTVAA